MSKQHPVTEHLSRRTALAGVATVGLGVPLLAACGSDAASDTSTGAASDPASTAPSTAGGSSSAPATGGDALATTADIEVGGGEIFPDDSVVVTQPTAGEFKAFSSICTHQGCPVQSVSDGAINCTCHGSSFSIEDGSPQSGPASEPLPPVEITVTGDQITLA